MSDELSRKMTELTIRKRLEEQGEQLMIDRKIAPGSTQLPAMPPVPTAGGIAVKTNIFRLHMDAPLPVHHYHVEGRFFFERPSGDRSAWEYTSQRREDTLAHERTALARKVFVALQLLHPHAMPREDRSVYDGASQLFALDPLKDGAQSIDITVTAAEWPDLQRIRRGAHSVRLSLQRTGRVSQLGHVARALPADINDNQKLAALVQFLELATSDSAADSDKHVLFRNGLCVLKEALDAGYTAADLAELPGGGSVAHGCRKSARAMGDGAEVAFGLVIDPKVVPMHDVELLSAKVLRQFPHLEQGPNGSVQQVAHFLHGLFFTPVHRNGSARLMAVDDISGTTAITQTLQPQEGGPQLTVQQYYKQKYEIELKLPQLPLVVVKRGRNLEHYPLELCEVAPNQRFAKHLIGADVQSALLKASPLILFGSTRLPDILERDIVNNLRELGLQSSDVLSEAHLRVDAEPVQVQAHVFDAPALRFQKSEQRLDLLKGNWRMDQYFRPAEVLKWAMYSLTRAGGFGGNNLTRDEARQFGLAFQAECRRKGMRMADVADFQLVEVPRNGEESMCMKKLLMNAQHRGFQFVLVVTGPQDNTIHDTLKYHERKHDNVLSTTARAAAGISDPPKRMTMENIVNKTNVKNGGLCYEISSDAAKKALGSRDLFIGVSSNLAGGGFQGAARGPTVVGYAATDKQHPADYSGNYVFQEALRDEKLKVIEGIVRVALERFCRHRGHAPDRVFLFRNSSSEGSYEHASPPTAPLCSLLFPLQLMRFEIPLVKNVLREKGAGTKLMFIVATRLHPIRLMPAVRTGGKALEQNLKPGTCVDAGITGPFVPEFFLSGHASRLGTAKVPRYSVLCNEAAMSMEDVQRTTFHLCFGHQIVPGMTSLPSPMYIGDEMAKRGRSIYNQAASHGEEATNSDDFNSLSEQLDYAACPRLRDLRFNA
ncbi:hypothetical protein M3Y99_00125500 [Aphelenchoides fujianensis]|nr:hypothetical protein M3Y99_00125500 [Aphelenchoides fujianensis]